MEFAKPAEVYWILLKIIPQNTLKLFTDQCFSAKICNAFHLLT